VCAKGADVGDGAGGDFDRGELRDVPVRGDADSGLNHGGAVECGGHGGLPVNLVVCVGGGSPDAIFFGFGDWRRGAVEVGFVAELEGVDVGGAGEGGLRGEDGIVLLGEFAVEAWNFVVRFACG